MRRREFVRLLGGAAAAWPLAARAQPAKLPVIAFLSIYPQSAMAGYLTSFRAQLAKSGFVDGRNVRVEFHTVNRPRMQRQVAQAIARQPDVIVSVEGPVIALAQAETSTIPIVFSFGGDPVAVGFIASLARPGGNMTGFSTPATEIATKQLDLLHKITPQTATIAFLTDLTAPFADQVANGLVAAGQTLVQRVVVVDVVNRDIEAAFATILREGAGAVLVGPYILFARNSKSVLELVARNKLPACFPGRSWCQRGGLMSYSANAAPGRLIVADYVARILKGAKPADLPVQRPTRFEFVINLQTARLLGLAVPPTLLVLADEVIE